MKKLLIVLAIIFGIFVLVLIGAGFYLTNGLNVGEKVAVNPVDLSKLDDGIYTGTYDYARWANEVQVSVTDSKITDIKVVKDVAFVRPDLKDEVITRVIEKQNTDIDITSGATVTTKAYLKAIENALSQ